MKDSEFNGVSERGIFSNANGDTFRDSHIHDAATDRSLAVEPHDNGCLSDFKII